MYRSNSDSLLEVADINGNQQVRSLRSRGGGQQDTLKLLETRLGLSGSVRQSLAGPVTALVANVEACLCLLDQLLREPVDCPETRHRIQNALILMRHASEDAKKTVGLMQHWKSLQQLTPGRKTLINLGQFTRDCGVMLKAQSVSHLHQLEMRIASTQSVYADQYGFCELLQGILHSYGTQPIEHFAQSMVECHDESNAVVVRIRQKLTEAEQSKESAGESVGASLRSETSYRGISQADIDTIASTLQHVGGHLQWSIVTSVSLDFGLSFRVSSAESSGR